MAKLSKDEQELIDKLVNSAENPTALRANFAPWIVEKTGQFKDDESFDSGVRFALAFLPTYQASPELAEIKAAHKAEQEADSEARAAKKAERDAAKAAKSDEVSAKRAEKAAAKKAPPAKKAAPPAKPAAKKAAPPAKKVAPPKRGKPVGSAAGASF